MKCKGGWRDTPDPSLVTVNVLGGSDAEKQELAKAMTSEERQQYMALAARAAARLKGEVVEIEATPVVDEGEPTGSELPLDE